MFSILKRPISISHKPYIIAEISANHNQSIENTLKLINSLKETGVDAIKLQTYTADSITIESNRPEFLINSKKSLWHGKRLYDLYKQGSMPWEWHKEIMNALKRTDIHCFSSPFDNKAVDFLEDLNVPAYKIASSEITDVNLVKYIAETGKPVILSTGMANLSEIHEAINSLIKGGCSQYAILKCTATYPTHPKDVNAKSIKYLRELFGCEVGLSDHTLGIGASISAVTLGASIVEKHVTLSRDSDGIDSKFSMEPNEISLLVQECNNAKDAIGEVSIGPTKDELSMLKFRRSLYVTSDIKKGEKFSSDNLRSIRPNKGIHPRYLNEIIGQKARINLKKGTPMKWGFVSN